MFGLVVTFDWHAEVVGLGLGQLGQLHADFFEVEARDLFVELLGQAIDADFVNIFVLPEIELREGLVGEGVGHHK